MVFYNNTLKLIIVFFSFLRLLLKRHPKKKNS
ncbi:MAG: hypothetical protein RJA00_1484 [Bacteroidota bacterium]